MSIPASQIVTVNPRLLKPGGTDLEFNGLLLSKSASIPSSQFVLPFPDPESVGDYFGLESDEYKASVVYFNGYNNSFKKPRAFYVALRNDEARGAFIRGGAFGALVSDTLASLKTITSGDISVRLGMGTMTATGVDLSAATSMSEIGTILTSALSPATTPATAGTLTSGAITVADLTAVTDGAFSIDVDGVTQAVSGLDFSAATDFASVAAVLQAALTGCTVAATADGVVITSSTTGASSTVSYAVSPATGTDVSALLALTEATGAVAVAGTDPVTPTDSVTVTYSSLFDAFTLTSTTTGAESGVDYAIGSLASALNLTEETGAVLSAGLDAMTETENMEAILDLTENFVCFTTVWNATKEEVLAYGQWASGKGVAYLFVFHDDSPLNLQANSTATIAAAVKAANIGATAGVYGGLEYAAMILGTAASIDWDRRQGVITFAFKSQDGVPANVIKGVDATNLKAQGLNFMGDYATRNDNFVFMYPGSMFGSWTWIDTYLNACWLNNALQVAIMAGFQQTPRVPYNDEGYTLIRSWCLDPIKRGLYSGIIDQGVTLSESQKAELYREAGRDISGELVTEGYVLQIVDPSPAVRQKRESPEASLWYEYGGSVHRLDLASTAVV